VTECHLALLPRLEEFGAEMKRKASSLLKEKDYLEAVKGDLSDRLSRFACVKEYLSHVVEESKGEYVGIKQLVDRGNSIFETRTKLQAKNQRMIELISKKEAVLANHNVVSEISGGISSSW